MTPLLKPPIAPLFVPGNRPERFAKAAASGADAVIIDLEDAVSPQDKDQARRNAAAHAITAVPVIIRINGADTPWFEQDVAMLANCAPACVMVAKAAVGAIDAVVTQCAPAWVLPLVETAEGMATLDRFLGHSQVICAAFGALDCALDLGCSPDWEPLLACRSELVLRSRLAGIAPPIEGVTTAIDDIETLVDDCRRARAIGFGGKLAIHPSQIAAIQTGFAFTDEERAWARAVMNAQAGDCDGAVAAAGSMIDKPVLERARRIIAGDVRG